MKKSHAILSNDINNKEYRLQTMEFKKKSHAKKNNNNKNNKEKKASSKLVGVKCCDIHKEWYINA